MMIILLSGLLLLALVLVVYIFGFIFLSGSSPGSDKSQDAYVNATCAPNGLLKTVLTWGYAKASFRRFYDHYRLMLFPQPQALLGQKAPDCSVVSLTGKSQRLIDDYISKMPAGENKVASILTVYILEAHASDEWRLPESQVEAVDKTQIRVHRNLQERLDAAKLFVERRSFPKGMQLVVDSMDDQANARYDAWPERLYIIVDGVVVYKGGYGPFDYKLWEVQDWLAARYGMRGPSLKKG